MQPKVSESVSLANFSSRPPVCPFGCAALFVWTQCSKRAGSCYFIFSVLVVCAALAYQNVLFFPGHDQLDCPSLWSYLQQRHVAELLVVLEFKRKMI